MNIQFMDTETTSQIWARVSRKIEALEEGAGVTTETAEQHAYLCEVAQALEIVGGFLNAELAAYHDTQRVPDRTDREVFNTP